MSKSKSPTQVDILDTIYSLKNKLGVKVLSEKLNELDQTHSDSGAFQEDLVIEEVCACVEIDRAYLLDKKLYSTNDKKKNAITFTSVILFDYFGYSLNRIAAMFNMERTNISKRKNQFKSLDRTNRIDVLTTSVFDMIIENLQKKKIIKKKK